MKLCDQVFSLYLAQVYRARATSQHEVEIADADEAKDLFQVTCFEIEPFHLRAGRVGTSRGDDDRRLLVLQKAFVA